LLVFIVTLVSQGACFLKSNKIAANKNFAKVSGTRECGPGNEIINGGGGTGSGNTGGPSGNSGSGIGNLGGNTGTGNIGGFGGNSGGGRPPFNQGGTGTGSGTGTGTGAGTGTTTGPINSK